MSQTSTGDPMVRARPQLRGNVRGAVARNISSRISTGEAFACRRCVRRRFGGDRPRARTIVAEVHGAIVRREEIQEPLVMAIGNSKETQHTAVVAAGCREPLRDQVTKI